MLCDVVRQSHELLSSAFELLPQEVEDLCIAARVDLDRLKHVGQPLARLCKVSDDLECVLQREIGEDGNAGAENALNVDRVC